MIIDTHVHIGGESVGFHMNEDMVIEAMQVFSLDRFLREDINEHE